VEESGDTVSVVGWSLDRPVWGATESSCYEDGGFTLPDFVRKFGGVRGLPVLAAGGGHDDAAGLGR